MKYESEDIQQWLEERPVITVPLFVYTGGGLSKLLHIDFNKPFIALIDRNGFSLRTREVINAWKVFMCHSL